MDIDVPADMNSSKETSLDQLKTTLESSVRTSVHYSVSSARHLDAITDLGGGEFPGESLCIIRSGPKAIVGGHGNMFEQFIRTKNLDGVFSTEEDFVSVFEPNYEGSNLQILRFDQAFKKLPKDVSKHPMFRPAVDTIRKEIRGPRGPYKKRDSKKAIGTENDEENHEIDENTAKDGQLSSTHHRTEEVKKASKNGRGNSRLSSSNGPTGNWINKKSIWDRNDLTDAPDGPMPQRKRKAKSKADSLSLLPSSLPLKKRGISSCSDSFQTTNRLTSEERTGSKKNGQETARKFKAQRPCSTISAEEHDALQSLKETPGSNTVRQVKHSARNAAQAKGTFQTGGHDNSQLGTSGSDDDSSRLSGIVQKYDQAKHTMQSFLVKRRKSVPTSDQRPDQSLAERRKQRPQTVTLEPDVDEQSSQDSVPSNSSTDNIFQSSPIEEYHTSKQANNNESFVFWEETMNQFATDPLY